MPVILFGTSRSRAFRVLWMLEEIGLPYAHRPIPVDRCATDSELRAVNPAQTIPFLLDDGFGIGESLAINLWLARKGGVLSPADARDEAAAVQWSFWATGLEPAYVQWASHSFWLSEDRRDPSQAAAALDDLQRPLQRLEVALAEREWLLGERFSVADLNVAAVVPLLRRADLAAHPRVARWIGRCCSRDAYARAGALA